MIQLPVLPILVPLTMAALSLLLWRQRRLQQTLAVVGTALHLGAAVALLLEVHRQGYVVLQLGSWPAPYGITLVADLFAAAMTVMAGIMGLTVAIYSLAGIDLEREAFGYYPFLHVLLAGVCGCFLTGDLFNLYVWFEVMLMASFVLLALGGERRQLEGAVKYVTLNLVGSTFFLSALGLLYGLVGTLNMADLAQQLGLLARPGIASILAMLFLAAFGLKAALFPFFFWLPASYHTPPPAVSALFAGLLTKVGVYSLMRVFTLLFLQEIPYTHGLILVLSGVTMVTGVLGAVAQSEMRRLLSFHIISQVGYMTMGLALLSPLALAGGIVHMLHNILAKSKLFLVSGTVLRLRGTTELGKLGGLARTAPGLGALFLISALALAGLPPLFGFWSKLMLVWGGLKAGSYPIVVAALAVSLLTLFSMTKIWRKAFWGVPPEADREPSAPAASPLSAGARCSLYLPMIALAALTLGAGLLVEPVCAFALRAADQLLHPQGYIGAVLGGRS